MAIYRLGCGLLALILLISGGVAAQAPPSQTVIFWHHYADEGRAAFWDDMAAEFNTKQNTVLVEVQFFAAYHNQHDAILAALLNGGLPDVALVRPYDAALYQLSDALRDLTPLVATDLNANDFYPLIWGQDVQNGLRLGLPLTRASEALYINLDALRELGYSTPPTTRAEWSQMACDFRAAEGWSAVESAATSTGFDMRLDATFWLGISHPVAVFNPAITTAPFDFTQANLVGGVGWLQQLIGQNCIYFDVTQLHTAQTRFASGQTLFYIQSSAARPYIQAAIETYFAQPFRLGVVPLPATAGPVTPLYGPSLSLFRSDPAREDAAWEWMAWLAQAEQVERWATANASLPARRDVPTDPAFPPNTWTNEPTFAGYDLVRDEMVFALRGILGGQPIPTSLDNLTQTANRIHQAFRIE